MLKDSWQVATHSRALQAGNYYKARRVADAHWGVRVIIPISLKTVVLVKHDDQKQGPFWLFPGGGVKLDETIPDAGVREVKEETGLDIVIDKLVYIREALPGELEFYVLASAWSGTMELGYDPEFPPDEQVLREVNQVGLDVMSQSATFIIYPQTVRQRLAQDWQNGWPRALYLGAVP